MEITRIVMKNEWKRLTKTEIPHKKAIMNTPVHYLMESIEWVDHVVYSEQYGNAVTVDDYTYNDVEPLQI